MSDRALRVRDFCRNTILSTDRHCPVYDAIRWMDEHHSEFAAITDEVDGVTVAVGIVTRESLANVILTRRDYDDLTLDNVMNPSPVIVNEEDDLDMAASWLRETGLRVAIVVNRAWDLVGTLSLADMGELTGRRGLLASAA